MTVEQLIQNKTIKYIATDLDGTILLRGAQHIPKEFFTLIPKLQEKGIRFIVASGRQLANEQNLFAPLSDQLGFVADNGALVAVGRQVRRITTIDRETGLRMIDTVREWPGCNCYLSCPSVCYLEDRDPAFITHIRDNVGYVTRIVPDLREVEEPFVKLAVQNQQSVEEVSRQLQAAFGNEMNVVTSGNAWVDILERHANKGKALAELLEELGIDPADGVAFGDQDNDIQMVQLAGVGCAVENASAGLKAAADCVVPDALEAMKMLARAM